MIKKIGKYFEEKKLPKFRLRQLETAIFEKSVSNFDQITTFPKWLREDLEKNFKITSLFQIEVQKSKDSAKFLLKTEDGNLIETVLMIHNDGRRTICVSCQVFCAVGCKFCATGANMYKRSLTYEEIYEQAIFVNKYLKQFDEKISNVVFMGMGEPFLNFKNVIKAIEVFKNKFKIGAKHIVVSTSGIIPKIYEFIELDLKIRLAISLHAPNTKLRSQIMPINDKYPLKELIKACDYFTKKTNKRISYEYVLIKGINDLDKCAFELAKLLNGKLAHVNLLIYNPHKFSKFEKPEKNIVLNFRDILKSEGIEVSIRKSLGDEIDGACGQLSGKQSKHS